MAGRLPQTLWRLAALPFEALVAILAIHAAAMQLLGGADTSAIAMTGAPRLIDYAWVISYGISGLLVLIGLASGRLQLEAAGVIWLAGAVAINVAALLSLPGGPQPRLVPFVATIIVCLTRAVVILAGRNVILIRWHHHD